MHPQHHLAVTVVLIIIIIISMIIIIIIIFVPNIMVKWREFVDKSNWSDQEDRLSLARDVSGGNLKNPGRAMEIL